MNNQPKNSPSEPDREEVKAAFNRLLKIYQETPPEERRRKLAQEIGKMQREGKERSTRPSGE